MWLDEGWCVDGTDVWIDEDDAWIELTHGSIGMMRGANEERRCEVRHINTETIERSVDLKIDSSTHRQELLRELRLQRGGGEEY